MDSINILLIDDHQVVREGIRRMLELEDDLKVVGEASTADEALPKVATLSASNSPDG
jgi:DNA-binding NarL/FixJ family response regulator